MPVLSAVLHLRPTGQEALLEALREQPGLSLGPCHDRRLPVVVESADRDEDKALWRRLETLEGVEHIELVFADFSDLISLEGAR